ncbi:MAG: hypothetical protein KJP22_12750 [Acidimicrobiia bacterium]|nr:hypothetical protein [Acidimicrobiia bacterium]MBT8194266.1 hypothetical protein [Acidimicrobiia bacterium]MBT8247586.1 hypothetical protein [Acidimicrobiia bacterium]NNL12215.1 hypothetical protein [Acidimicrobiia bacterium]
MDTADNEIRIYRGTPDLRPGGRCVVEVEGLDGTHPLVNHTETDFAWGYGGAGPATLAECIVIDALGRDARCRRCAGGGIDPESGREEATCRDCGGDGWSDFVALAAQVVKDHLVAPLPQDVSFQLTSEQAMDIILRVRLDSD